MKKYLISFINRLKAKYAEQEEQQRLRRERLKELEESQSQKGFHLINSIKTKKDILVLRREIKQYEDKKRSGIALIAMCGIMVFCLLFLGIGAIFDKEENVSVPSSNSVVESITNNNTTENTTTSTAENTTTIVATEQQTTQPTTSTNPEQSIALITPDEEESQPAADDYANITIDDIDVSARTDFSHFDFDTITLGNDEGFTVTILVKGLQIRTDDLFFYFDDSLLNVEIREPYYYDGNTRIEVYLTGKQACSTDFSIFTMHDIIVNDAENTFCITYPIHKLDRNDGRIVYLTPNGEKYHYSAKCAGENASATTLYEAINYEKSPCGKCAS